MIYGYYCFAADCEGDFTNIIAIEILEGHSSV